MSKRTKLYPFAVGCRLTGETHAQLVAVAAAQGRSVSVLLRRVVEAYVAASVRREDAAEEGTDIFSGP